MKHELGYWEDSRGLKNDGRRRRSCSMHDSVLVALHHSTLVKSSVSFHGTNFALDLRPCDRHVLCSHIDALYLISNTAALNLCCRLWLSRPESDPVSALPVYAEIRPRIASRSSAWVMCHSCSIVAWWNQLGDGEAEVVVFVTDYYTSVDPSFCFLAMPGEHWLKKCSHRKSCKSCSRVSPLRPAQRIKENYPWGKPSNFMLGTPFNFKREREREYTLT